ncbi:MAG: endolytic transglycosylase MltG, partial [Cyanobacteria bacterium P01_A01_bin.17]
RVPIDLPESQQIVHIPTGSSFEDVLGILTKKGILEDPIIFKQLAEYLEYKEDPMRAGRFKIEPGITLTDLVQHLKEGKQATVNVIMTNERLLEDVAAKVARFLESDSLTMINMFHNDIEIAELGYTRDNLMSLFIPNTYNFYWNTSPKLFLQRMVKEHDKFWKAKNRLAKAKKLGLSTKPDQLILPGSGGLMVRFSVTLCQFIARLKVKVNARSLTPTR